MKYEIKEILKYIDQFVYVDQTYNDIKLSKIDTKLILDYITNLQQENEKLKEEYKECFNLMAKFRDKALERELIYKSRCEKAIEYIKSYNLPEDLGYFGEAPISISELRHLLNILNGSDENE